MLAVLQLAATAAAIPQEKCSRAEAAKEARTTSPIRVLDVREPVDLDTDGFRVLDVRTDIVPQNGRYV